MRRQIIDPLIGGRIPGVCGGVKGAHAQCRPGARMTALCGHVRHRGGSAKMAIGASAASSELLKIGSITRPPRRWPERLLGSVGGGRCHSR